MTKKKKRKMRECDRVREKSVTLIVLCSAMPNKRMKLIIKKKKRKMRQCERVRVRGRRRRRGRGKERRRRGREDIPISLLLRRFSFVQ